MTSSLPMWVSDGLAVLGVLCLVGPLVFIAMVWWECHCEDRAARRRAKLRARIDRDWNSPRPEQNL